MSNRFQSMDGWLENVNGKLYVVSKYELGIKEKFKTTYGYFYAVIAGWESWNGCYWFQLTKENKNKVCFGFGQLTSAEFGNFYVDELDDLKKTLKVWRIGKINLPYSGITDRPENWFFPICSMEIIWKSQKEKELYKTLYAVEFNDDELLCIISSCSYPIKGGSLFELVHNGQKFGTYELLEDEKAIRLDVSNEELFKRAILDFQAGRHD